MVAGEFYFVLDRSGSMDGTPIKVAVEALKLFLKSLPIGSKFNVYSFGSEFKTIFSNSADYTEKNITKALEKIKNFTADYGGTEIFKPLESIFKSKSKTSLKKHVYLLTDGSIDN